MAHRSWGVVAAGLFTLYCCCYWGVASAHSLVALGQLCVVQVSLPKFLLFHCRPEWELGAVTVAQREYSTETKFIRQAHEPTTYKFVLTKVYRTQAGWTSQSLTSFRQSACPWLSVFCISLGILLSNAHQNDPLSSMYSVVGLFKIKVPNFHIPLRSHGLWTMWSGGLQRWSHFSGLCFCCACLRKCVM